MRVPFQDLRRQEWDLHSIFDVLTEGQFILGPRVERFEEEMAAVHGVADAAGVASGTDALMLALAGQEARHFMSHGRPQILTTPYTFVATASAIDKAEMDPTFVDIAPDSMNMSPDSLWAMLNGRTRGFYHAIVPVHIFGHPCDDRIYEIAAERRIPVIEDACQAVGTPVRGDFACLSFFPTKNLGCAGDGGMVLGKDCSLIRKLRAHGDGEMVGWNSRLDALQAHILHQKLPRLAGWTRKRQAFAAEYTRAFTDVVQTPPSGGVFNQYVIRTPKRDELRAHLLERGVETRVYYETPLHRHPAFSGDCPEADRAAAECLALPIFPELTSEERGHVIESVLGFFR